MEEIRAKGDYVNFVIQNYTLVVNICFGVNQWAQTSTKETEWLLLSVCFPPISTRSAVEIHSHQ
jgi:hypothetical protein